MESFQKNHESFTLKWLAAQFFAVAAGLVDARNGVTRHEKTFSIDQMTH